MLINAIHIHDYYYELPHNRIAQYPPQNREDSKLLIYKKGHILENSFSNLIDYLPEHSLLVFNNTRVIQARLLFQTTNRKTIEVFCLEPAVGNDVSFSMSAVGSVRWNCLIGGAAKWKEEYVYYKSEIISVKAKIIEKVMDVFVVEFSWEPNPLTFSEILSSIGAMPIPPYLSRPSESIDNNRYQTIYSKTAGSVAAPTAGLHFTSDIIEKLQLKNIQTSYLTLHVGAGTFKPIKVKDVREHTMHSEFIDVELDTIKQIINAIKDKKTIVPVGTTSTRTIESLYWLGVKIHLQKKITIDELVLKQWEVYEMDKTEMLPEIALDILLDFLIKQNFSKLLTKTSIIIVPGYQFRIVNALITNFHQPESSLMLLVAAIVGDDWKKIYNYALENNFRFLSYGDSSLLFL